MRSGSAPATAPIATDPSNDATVERNASAVSTPAAMRRDTSAGITLASVVISGGSRSDSSAFRSA